MIYRGIALFYFGVVVVLSYFYFVRNLGYAVDDSFITYRYAYHLKEGFGLVFNVGENYYGTTAAGYAVLLATLSAVGTTIAKVFGFNGELLFDVPTVSTFLAMGAIGSIAALLPTIVCPGNSLRSWMLCFFGAFVLFVTVPFNQVSGHETYPYLAASFIGVVLIAYKRAYGAGAIFLALAVSFRPDAILFGGIVPLLDWMRSGLFLKNYLKRRETIKFILVYAVLLCFWFALLYWHFGAFLPGTMEAKKVQVALGYFPLYSLATTAGYVLMSLGSLGLLVLIIGLVFWGAGMGGKIRSKNVLQDGDVLAGTWLLFGLVSTTVYLMLNVTFWPWYGVPLVFSLMVVGFVGWRGMLTYLELLRRNDGLLKGVGGNVLISVPLVLMIIPAFTNPGLVYEWAKSKNVNAHISAYSEMVEFIRDDAPGGAVIQMAEPGSFGYRLGPKYFVVDELGLISPGVAAGLVSKDFSYPIEKWRPDYLICSWAGTYSACFHGLEKEEFVLIGEFNEGFWKQYLGHGARLYKRAGVKGRAA